MNVINFAISKAEADLISRIMLRAEVDKCDRQDFSMDITACHCNGNPLRLADLLAADDFNFAHDINGIRRNLNRDTGKLMNCFSPRFSRRDGVAK